jgi:hypothetical protein
MAQPCRSPEDCPLTIPLVALAILTGGLTIELLWAQGPLVAFLSAPFAASFATALTAIPFRGS